MDCEPYTPALTHAGQLCPAVHICGELAGLVDRRVGPGRGVFRRARPVWGCRPRAAGSVWPTLAGALLPETNGGGFFARKILPKGCCNPSTQCSKGQS